MRRDDEVRSEYGADPKRPAKSPVTFGIVSRFFDGFWSEVTMDDGTIATVLSGPVAVGQRLTMVRNGDDLVPVTAGYGPGGVRALWVYPELVLVSVIDGDGLTSAEFPGVPFEELYVVAGFTVYDADAETLPLWSVVKPTGGGVVGPDEPLAVSQILHREPMYDYDVEDPTKLNGSNWSSLPWTPAFYAASGTFTVEVSVHRLDGSKVGLTGTVGLGIYAWVPGTIVPPVDPDDPPDFPPDDPPPDDPPATLWGVDTPDGGNDDVPAWATATGVDVGFFRAFGGPSNSLANAEWAAVNLPGVDILLSCKFASDWATVTDAEMQAWHEDAQELALTLTGGARLITEMDPEPELPARSYDAAQFKTIHTRWAALGDTYSPSCPRAWNVSGASANDFRDWEPVDSSEWSIFAWDPYALSGASEGYTTGIINDPHAWATTTYPGRETIVAECGAEVGDDQDDSLTLLVNTIGALVPPPSRVGYFENDASGAGAWDTRVIGSGNEALLGVLIAALG